MFKFCFHRWKYLNSLQCQCIKCGKLTYHKWKKDKNKSVITFDAYLNKYNVFEEECTKCFSRKRYKVFLQNDYDEVYKKFSKQINSQNQEDNKTSDDNI